MVTRCLDTAHRAAWLAGDEVRGGNPTLRAALEERGTGYVLAVAWSHEATTGAFRAGTLARKVPKRAWQKLSAGSGAKGQRLYDWAVIDLTYLEYQGVSPRSREPIGRPTAVAQRGAPQRSRRTGKMRRTRSRPLRRS